MAAMVIAQIALSSLLCAASAANVVLRLSYGDPRGAALSAVVLVFSGCLILLGCTRLILLQLAEDKAARGQDEEGMAR
jgi:hypothetical protein